MPTKRTRKMKASRKPAKRATRKTTPAARSTRQVRHGRFVLFPTEQSTIGRKTIETAVTAVVERRSS